MKEQNRIRIEDVAAAAGVSMKTVSRVFNYEPNVRPDTREKVESAARALNYRPNPSARSLASNRSYLIALLYDNPSSNYIMEIIGGVLDACRSRHYSMMLQPMDDGGADAADGAGEGYRARVENVLAQYRPDGMILTPPITDDDALLDWLHAERMPYASISPRRRTGQIGATLDEREAAAELVSHVASLGHTRIGHITGHRSHGARAWRLDGYRDALHRAGLPFDPSLVVEGEFSFDSGIEGARTLLDLAAPPTAIFAANDDTAAGVIYEAEERGLRIPRDLSVFGFDDMPMARQIWPSLTTVRQPSHEMGRIAAEQLLAHIGDAQRGELIKVPYEMRLRRSTGAWPARGS
ncbi:MAG TPA: LacI family DNA-binding transcriptional regulator [Stenotrophomonas sp.]|nr:LacI family DNA-binding transcriptional regulator [Stenotrophomonas sp.]